MRRDHLSLPAIYHHAKRPRYFINFSGPVSEVQTFREAMSATAKSFLPEGQQLPSSALNVRYQHCSNGMVEKVYPRDTEATRCSDVRCQASLVGLRRVFRLRDRYSFPSDIVTDRSPRASKTWMATCTSGDAESTRRRHTPHNYDSLQSGNP